MGDGGRTSDRDVRAVNTTDDLPGGSRTARASWCCFPLQNPSTHICRAHRTRCALVALCGLVLAALTGCARPAYVPEWVPWHVAVTPTPMPPPLTLLAPAGNDAANAVVADAVHAFEANSRGVTVAGMLDPDYTETLQTRLADGEIPDVFVVWSQQLGGLVADGQVTAIPSAYTGSSALPANLASAMQVDGTTYCLPRDVATLALYYNPAVFDRTETETAYPVAGWRWEELAAAAAATTDVNFGFYGLAMELDVSRLHPFLLQASTDADLWSGPDAATAVDFFMELFDNGFAVEPLAVDSSWAGEAFGRGHIAMTIEGPWLVDYLAAEFPDLDYAIVESPTGPAGRGTTAFVSCWAIGATRIDDALALVTALNTPERASELAAALGTLPPSVEQATALLGTRPRLGPFVAGLAYATPWTGPAGFIAQVEAANTAMRLWLNDEATTDDLLASIATLGTSP